MNKQFWKNLKNHLDSMLVNKKMPDNPKEGQMYYDTSTNTHKVFKDGNWYDINFNFNLPKNIGRKTKIKSILK